MDLRHKAALMALKGALARDVDFRDIEDSLISSGLITLEDKQIIMKAGSTNEQTSTLVDLLVKKSDTRTFNCLISSLAGPYSFWSSELSNYQQSPQIYLTKSTSDYEAVFINGGIPIAPQGNIELKYVSELKESLVKLSARSDGGWILVKGHGGAGKSVITAQAIRGTAASGSPIASYFFNHVFWFTIGNLRSDELDSLLLAKMQNICIRLNPELRATPPGSLTDATNELRKVMIEKYPCGLIVLDDVWEPKILRHFNVQARIVVTSRKEDIFRNIQTGDPSRRVTISVNEGFTEDAAVRLLTQMINSEHSQGQVSDSFSDQDLQRIHRLHTKCKGNPFIVSIFGGLLRGRLNQFERFLKKYEDNLLNNVDLEPGDYQYESIKDAILVSIDDLEYKYKEHYLHLTIFPEDTFLSVGFLSTFCWRDEDGSPLAEDDCLDLMVAFSRRSIATIETYQQDVQLLTLHDLIVSAMKNEFKEKRTSYNNQFVENVLSLKKNLSSWIEIDSSDEFHYLAYNLVYHLVSCDVISLDNKLEILRDFDFISWLCCRIGADNLAFVYQYSIKFFNMSDATKKSLTDFVDFFRSPIFRIQSTYLATRRSDSAMIQLALTLSEGNIVRECAEEAAKKHRNFFCFYYWLNAGQTEEQIYNTIKVDSDVTNFAFDRYCKHAVVTSDSSAVILDLSTGLRTFHVRKEDMVTSDSRGDAEGIEVVAALFRPNNESLLILTEYALYRYPLPSSAFDVGVRPSPAAPPPSEEGSLHFPHGRPRSGTTGRMPPYFKSSEPVYKENRENENNSVFTAMCFESEDKLLVGGSDGKMRVFTLTDRITNLSSEFFIDQERDLGNAKINHIAAVSSVNATQVAVSGPNDCVYIYESRYEINKYTGHASNSNPIQCVFEPRPGPQFAASIANNEIHLWNPRTLNKLHCEHGPRVTSFTSIAINSEGVYLAVGTSTRAHIYLYRVTDLTESTCKLQLVNELNGSGSFTKCLAFPTSGKSFLYSTSEMSTEGVLTCWKANLSTTPFHAPNTNISSIFFGPENITLRLRTVFDAVTVNNEIIVACQSVRKSLIILKSSENDLRTVENGKLSGEENRLSKAATIRLAPSGKYAVFTFYNKVIIGKECNESWTFNTIESTVKISDIVFLYDCQGFIGSNRSDTIVVYRDCSCVQQLPLPHKQLLPVDLHLFSTSVSALLLFDRGWKLLSSDELNINQSVAGSMEDDLQESLLCCNSCPYLFGFVAGGTDLGSMILWKVAGDNTACIVDRRSRKEEESRNCPLRCLRFSHRIGEDTFLLAAAFDDSRFSLWAMRDGRLIDLVDCQPVQIGVPLQPSDVGCIAWTVHTDQNRVRHHKLIIASDCVHVCCLPDSELRDRLYTVPSQSPLKLGMVSLYSRQSINKVQVLRNGRDLLFVDNSHTVFWMRSLHCDDSNPELQQQLPSVPNIPFGDSHEQI